MLKKITVTLIFLFSFVISLGNTFGAENQNNQSTTQTSQSNSDTIQIKTKLTLKKAINLALKRSIDYENALLNMEIIKMKIKQARATAYYPDITFGISGTFHWYPKKDDISSMFDNWTGKNTAFVGAGELTISKPIFTWGALSHGIMLQEDRLKIQTIEAEKIKKKLILSVKQAFYGTLIAQEQYKVALESYKLNRSNFRIANRNYARGLKSKVEVLQIQVNMEESRSRILDAQTNYKNFKNQLADLIGPLAKKKGTILKGSLKTKYFTLTYDQALRQAYSNNNDIAQAEINYSISKHNRVITQSNARPIISVFGSSTISHSAKTSFDMMSMSSSRTGSQINYFFAVGIRIDFPLTEMLFPNSRTSSQVGEIDYQIRFNKNFIQRIKETIQLKLSNHYERIKSLKKQIELYKKLLIIAKTNLRLAQARYRTGNMDYLTMRNIEIQFINVSYSFNKLLYDYIIIKTEILHEIGQTAVIER